MIQSLTRRNILAGAAATVPAYALAGVADTFAAAPMLGRSAATHFRFKLGDFEITTLLDGYRVFGGPHPVFGQNADQGDVQDLAESRFLPREQMAINFTPVAVNTGDALVLFDSGNAPSGQPKVGNLVDSMKGAGYSPDQVDHVVITHMHPDHIGGLSGDGATTFGNASHHAGAVELDFWLSKTETGLGERVNNDVKPILDAQGAATVDVGNEIATGITAINAFGHTPGHMAYHIESAGKQLLLWGDTANHFIASVEKPEWHVQFDMDKEGAGATRKRLFDMAFTEKIMVAGYHMPFPGIGFIDKTASGYHWVPESYQTLVE